MTDPRRAGRQPVFYAAAWMSGALISFVVLAVAGREAARELDTFGIMALRSLIAIPIILAIASRTANGFTKLRTARPGLQALRNCAHFVGQFCWFYALTVIPLAHVFALEFTTPVWVALLAPLLIGERMTKTRLLSALIGFIGVLIVIRPGAAPINIGMLIMLVGAVGFALSVIAVKRLTRTDNALAIIFYMNLLQLPVALLAALPNLTMPSAEVWGWMVLVAGCALTAHFCMARAFLHADAVIVAPMDFLRLPMIAAVGVLVYAEPLAWGVIVGGLVIMLANYINIAAEQRRTSAS